MPTDWGGGAGADIGRTLAELGRIRGENSIQQGNIWGHAIANIGNTIENAPLIQLRQQEMQARAADLQGLADERRMHMLAAQRDQQGSQALAKAIGDPANEGDPEKVYHAVASMGFPEQGQKFLDAATKHSETLGKLTAAKGAEHQAVADLLDGADPNDTAGIQARLGLAHTRGVDTTPYAQLLDQLGPEQGLRQIVDSAPENVKAGRTRKEKAAEEAAKVVVGHPGDVFLQGGQEIGSVPDRTKERVPAAAGSFEDYVTRYAQSQGKPVEALTTVDIEQTRKRFNQADDKATSFAAADQTKLSPSAIDLAALNYRKTGVMPPLGMGDKSNRQAILNRAATLTPDDITKIEAGGGDIAANKAGYGADSSSLKKLQQQRDAISAFENTAKKNIDRFLQTAGKVVDTGSPLANSFVRAVNGRVLGDPNVAEYDAARQVALSEIAKIVNNPNLSGTLSDSARKEIEAFNPNNATLKQSVAVMRLLQQDMTNRATSLDEQLGAIKGRLSGGAAAPKQAAPASGGPTLTYEDYKRAKGIK